jgi:hypothetical protein
MVSVDYGDPPTDLPTWAWTRTTYAPDDITVPGRRAAWHLADALRIVPDDHHVVIMEDDDWYAASHIETLIAHIEQGHGLAGHDTTRFYHVPLMRYMDYACATAGEGAVAIRNDKVLWYSQGLPQEHWCRNSWSILKDQSVCPPTSVGIKGVGSGLPGRTGATGRHGKKKAESSMMFDPKYSVFRQWTGDDAQCYINLVRP